MQTERNPGLTVHLNSQVNVFRMNVAFTSSYWCRGKPNLFLIAKPNGLCVGSAMLVGTCRFYSPLPLCEHESRLAGPVFEHGRIGKEKPCRYFARGGGGEGGGLSICQRCHCKWMYLPICYHLLIMDLGDNCHKSCHKMCHKTHFLGAEGDVWRGMKCLGSRDHKAWAVSLFHTPMNTHIVASVRLLQAT